MTDNPVLSPAADPAPYDNRSLFSDHYLIERLPGRSEKKLQATRVPAFDPDIDLTPLVELSSELETVRRRIGLTDSLIDQIVYRLYGLTEDEIALVEGRDLSV